VQWGNNTFPFIVNENQVYRRVFVASRQRIILGKILIDIRMPGFSDPEIIASFAYHSE